MFPALHPEARATSNCQRSAHPLAELRHGPGVTCVWFGKHGRLSGLEVSQRNGVQRPDRDPMVG